ncbi:hypothetical protein NS44R_14690, partial [Mammaliicoccus sciuri]
MAMEGCCQAVGTGFFGCLSLPEGDQNAPTQAPASTTQGPPRQQRAARSGGDHRHRLGGDTGRRQDLHRVRVLRQRPRGAVAAVPGAQIRHPQPRYVQQRLPCSGPEGVGSDFAQAQQGLRHQGRGQHRRQGVARRLHAWAAIHTAAYGQCLGGRHTHGAGSKEGPQSQRG